MTQEPLLNDLANYLDAARLQILEAPDEPHVLRFSRRELEEVRKAFTRMIRRGEKKLHRFCELLGDSLLSSSYTLQSVIVGEVNSSGERFTLVEGISSRDLYSQTDLDMGNRRVERLRFRTDEGWSRAGLVANFVEYEAREANQFGVHKFISRIKAEEEIWNKVVDEIFDLDQLVRQDKQLRHLGRYVKDVFGGKAVVAEDEGVRQLHQALTEIEWDDEQLRRHNIPAKSSYRRLHFLEVKDYLARGRKASGWRALKSVVQWGGTTIEIQIQPLRNFHRERERVSRESHAEFKFRREELRNQIARLVPLFGFYRDLLRWLFLRPDELAPSFGSVEVVLED